MTMYVLFAFGMVWYNVVRYGVYGCMIGYVQSIYNTHTYTAIPSR